MGTRIYIIASRDGRYYSPFQHPTGWVSSPNNALHMTFDKAEQILTKLGDGYIGQVHIRKGNANVCIYNKR